MGIELARLCPESEETSEYTKGFTDGFYALKNTLLACPHTTEQDLTEILASLDSWNLLEAPRLTLPEKYEDLGLYLANLQHRERVQFLGFWNRERVHVNLNVCIPLDTYLLSDSRYLFPNEVMLLNSRGGEGITAFCVGCIQGTSTALIVLKSEMNKDWFLWNAHGGIEQPWKGMGNSSGAFITVDELQRIKLTSADGLWAAQFL
jgi:hypothetical protein